MCKLFAKKAELKKMCTLINVFQKCGTFEKWGLLKIRNILIKKKTNN